MARYAGARQLGGGGQDNAYKIALDNSNNVYVGVNIVNVNNNYPVHFSPTEVLPLLPPTTGGNTNAAYNRTFLVRYDSNGQFIWKQALQGDVFQSDRSNLLDITRWV